MSSPEPVKASHEAWLVEQLRNLSPRATVEESGGRLEIQLTSSRSSNLCLLCCWHEPWAERNHGVNAPLSLSALYTLDLLREARHDSYRHATAVFVDTDTIASRADAIDAGRRLFGDAANNPQLVIIAAGCAVNGGFASTLGSSPQGSLGLALPALDSSSLDEDVIEHMYACCNDGIELCVFDPVLGNGRYVSPADFWHSVSRGRPSASGEQANVG